MNIESQLSIPEVAKLLKVSTVTVHNWRIRGHLKAVRLPNGRYRVLESEVSRLLGNPSGERVLGEHV